ncbi:hypothetical protein ACFV2Q_27580 [Streptomyces sp. NPDC059650]|uniref:hypothetical protein n=1 Tax=Streptomyces sp. NPDC059650 TaxID=3346896 RepID=UPI0036AA26A4
MKITIEGASPDFERKLLELLAEHRKELAVSVDTEWNVERAVQYLASLPANALTFARLVVEADGDKSAEELREAFGGQLRGPTIALSRAIGRGERRKWWPYGTHAPIYPHYDPNHTSWEKAIAYRMTSENVAVFREAFDRIFNPK